MLPSLIVIEGELVNPPTLLGRTPRGLGGPRLEAHSGVADVDEEAEVGQVDDSAQVQEHKLQMRFGGAVMGRLASELGSEEHTSELQSLMRNSYAVFSLKKTKKII